MKVNTVGDGAFTYMSKEGKHLRLATETATVVFRHINDRTQLLLLLLLFRSPRQMSRTVA